MRLVTWNCCRRSCADALRALEPLGADLAFLQEVGRPPTGSPACAWAGTNPKQGTMVAALSGKVSFTDAAVEGPESVPLAVGGAAPFLALNIWAQCSPSYVGHVNATLDRFRDVLRARPSVVAGDFNSEGEPGSDVKSRHARLVDRLRTEFGLISAYHQRHGVEHGAEEHATYFHQRHLDDPWHIDFCFIPQSWADGIDGVDVLDGEPWQVLSDHRPLVIDVRI